jgi:hypothetical protein
MQYREAAENIVRGMIDQLAALTEGSYDPSPMHFGLLKDPSIGPTSPSRRAPPKSL